MADFDSSLPIRTVDNNDVRVQIADGTTDSQLLKVNSDGTIDLGSTTLSALESITVQNGSGASAVNIQDGGNSITVDGTVELGATSLAALESITVQNGSGASAVNIQDGGNSITVDGTVNAIIVNDLQGTEICDYQTQASLAGAATHNFDYTVTASTTLSIHSVIVAASGRLKAVVAIETAAASGTYTTKAVTFTSTATPRDQIMFENRLKQVTGAKVRVSITNLDNQAQDVYMSLLGNEVAS